MSEYQYYEFLAIDRPLTEAEMTQLRGFSTRAQITPTSFVNEYHWGSFKGDADAWMDKYFDAHLYFANWGTRILQFRLPASPLALDEVREYLADESLSARQQNGNVILTFAPEHESGDYDDSLDHDGGRLARFVALRADLAHGDLRALYLGWLAGVGSGLLDDDALEPPVPPGLAQLSASLAALADFLRLDSDLVTTAAEASPPREVTALRRDEVVAWLATLPAAQKNEFLADALLGAPEGHPSLLLRRFLQAREAEKNPASAPPPRRTAGQLLDAAEALAEKHRQLAAAQELKRQKAETAAHTRRIDSLAGHEPRLWREIEAHIVAKPAAYDLAVRLLTDLRELAARQDRALQFSGELAELRERHARKQSLISRLTAAGL